ncbi:apocarotenoid-15,15'-oxygenase, partial [Mycobacterium tuberculosis]
AKREHGGGARGRRKDAASTDGSGHRGSARTSGDQGGERERSDPDAAKTRGKESGHGRGPGDGGGAAHPKGDNKTGERVCGNDSK